MSRELQDAVYEIARLALENGPMRKRVADVLDMNDSYLSEIHGWLRQAQSYVPTVIKTTVNLKPGDIVLSDEGKEIVLGIRYKVPGRFASVFVLNVDINRRYTITAQRDSEHKVLIVPEREATAL